MDYFRNFLGGTQGGVQPSGAETVERLCDRVQSSTLLDDRRDAVRALKSLSKRFRLEVGTQGMDILTQVLETDRSDAEIIGYTLDTLCHVMSNEPSEEDEELPADYPEDLGGQFTEIFIKKHENVGLLLSLLEEYDFHVRWPTVKLLTILLTNRSKDLQECILVSPMGVSKLMDLLSDSREIIRNDALLLLIQLTKGHANIQKIVAFENAFERLLDIVKDEGYSDGGIVVEDCLLLLLNLLKNNSSNQNFFRESSYVPRLKQFFVLDTNAQHGQAGWSAQKVTNIHLMLQIVRTLVSPNNPHQLTTSCQKVMHSSGILEQLCNILMASGVPADVLTETINTVAEVIRGNPVNQEYFASVLAPSNPPRPAIVVLLMSMVNEKQPFVLRCAVLYCFQSFLFKNEIGQSQIVQTLLPTSADANTITAGQLLCGGLFSVDSLSNWFASVAMLHAILDNPTQKEQLLRVQLATSIGNPPVSLLQQCCNMLAQGGKHQTRIGLLMLLCVWLNDCPVAVTHFLSNTANVPYLISQVSSPEGDELELITQGLCAFLLGTSLLANDDQNETFTKVSLVQIIEKRIGMELFVDKMNQVVKNENYSRAAKKPHLNYKQPSEVIFDFEFTRLLKALEGEVLDAVSSDNVGGMAKKKTTSLKEHENIVDQYKDIIRDQDQRLTETRAELETMQDQYRAARTELLELQQQVQMLRDQNQLIKAQKGSQVDGKKDETIAALQRDVDGLKSTLSDRDSQIARLKDELTLAEAKVIAQEGGEEDKENNPNEAAVLQATLNRLRLDLDEGKQQLTQREEQVQALETQLEQSQKHLEELRLESQAVASQVAVSQTDASKSAEWEAKVTALTEETRHLSEEKATLLERMKKANEENLRLLDKIRKLEESMHGAENDTKDIKEELETLKKEQDDLLVLLADQDAKIEKYKARLKSLGEEVEDDDDDLEDEDVDDDGDN